MHCDYCENPATILVGEFAMCADCWLWDQTDLNAETRRGDELELRAQEYHWGTLE